VRAHAHSLKAWFNTDYALCNQVIQEAREALAIDPNSTLALNSFAIAQYQLLTSGMAADHDAALRDALAASAKAVEIDPSDSLGYAYKAWLHCAQPGAGPLADALRSARRAVELNPNSAYALRALGFVDILAGEPQRAIEIVRRALRLSPSDPLRGNWFNLLAMASCTAGQYADGVEYALVATSETPGFAVAHAWLAANCVGLGDIEKAKASLDSARRLAPKYVERMLDTEKLVRGTSILRKPEVARRITTFLRIAAGLEDPSAAESLR
jgi:adenylate cyclase